MGSRIDVLWGPLFSQIKSSKRFTFHHYVWPSVADQEKDKPFTSSTFRTTHTLREFVWNVDSTRPSTRFTQFLSFWFPFRNPENWVMRILLISNRSHFGTQWSHITTGSDTRMVWSVTVGLPRDTTWPWGRVSHGIVYTLSVQYLLSTIYHSRRTPNQRQNTSVSD